MTTVHSITANTTATWVGIDVVPELSIWDALMVGRVSATRPGLRVRTTVAPGPTEPMARRQEVV